MLSEKKLAAIETAAIRVDEGKRYGADFLRRFARLVEAEALRRVASAQFSYARPDTRTHSKPVFVVNVWDLRDQARQAAKAAREGR